jgi:hypothetical protein
VSEKVIVITSPGLNSGSPGSLCNNRAPGYKCVFKERISHGRLLGKAFPPNLDAILNHTLRHITPTTQITVPIMDWRVGLSFRRKMERMRTRTGVSEVIKTVRPAPTRCIANT